MNPWVDEDWVPIIKDVRLSEAESALHAWLAERGLSMSDLPKDDFARQVGRLVGGGSFCSYYVRRSRLQQLLGEDPRGEADAD